MKVKELIKKLQKLDQELVIGVFGYEIEKISQDVDINGDKFYSIG